jgi:hypothetical protein
MKKRLIKLLTVAMICVMMTSVAAVGVYAASFSGQCGNHNQPASGNLSRSTTTVTASTVTTNHPGASVSVTVSGTYVSSSGYITVTNTATDATSATATVSTTSSYGFVSSSSTHTACNRTFALSD